MSSAGLKVTTPTDTTIILTRTFKAPRRLVWEAFFTPDKMRRWMLPPPGWTTTICECEPRVAGALRIVWKSEEADPAMSLLGVFTEVVVNERAIHTETMLLGSGQPIGSQVETHEFAEMNGLTTMRITQVYASKEARDGAVASGMDQGMEACYQQLDAVLAAHVAHSHRLDARSHLLYTLHIMKSQATTASAYLDSLPPDRREAIKSVRQLILQNLDPTLQECMQYGVIAYCVPHEGKGGWPHGHHTNPKLPLMYLGLSSQKNDMVVYMLFLLHNEPMREWFDKAWKATGKKNYLEVGGMGCCLRFKKLEDLSLDVIADAMRHMPVKKYLEDHVAMLARLGKGPDGKPLKKSEGKGKGGSATPPAKGTKAPKKKMAKKKAAAKRG